jgi:hypothetical protein
MNGLNGAVAKAVTKTVKYIIDDNDSTFEDEIEDVVDDMFNGKNIEEVQSFLYDLLEEMVNNDFEDDPGGGRYSSDEAESLIFDAIKDEIKKNKKKIDDKVRCIIKEMQGG